jgi:hypothetical protein
VMKLLVQAMKWHAMIARNEMIATIINNKTISSIISDVTFLNNHRGWNCLRWLHAMKWLQRS